MRMLILILFMLILISPSYALINEIMYNPLGSDNDREWIEIYSNNESIDISGWKFYEAGVNHNLNLKQGSFILDPNDYAIIAEDWSTFLVEYPNFNGTLLDSSFSLSNTGEIIALKNSSGNIVDNLTYSDVMGGNENGFSIGLYNNQWKETFPTPGFENEISNICDWNVEILTNKSIFENPDELEWKIKINKIYGESTVILINRWVENEFGNRIKTYNPLEHTITNQETLTYSPNLDSDSFYLIKTSIIPYCNDSNTDNNFFSKLIAIKGSELPKESNVKIENIYDLGSDEKAKFGQTIRVKVNIYKGDTTKNSIKLFVGDDERISKETRTNVYTEYTNYTLTLPIQLKPNCDNKLKDGRYYVRIEGLDDSDKESIRVEGVSKDVCDKITIESEKQKFEYNFLSYPDIIYPGKEFTTKIEIKSDDKSHELEVWNYVYRGSKSYSEEKESNKQIITLPEDSSVIIDLKNTILEAEPGDYKLKVKIKKDEQKTLKELTGDIKVGEYSSGSVTVQSLSCPETEFTCPKITERSYANKVLIYESAQAKAEKLVVYFMIGLMTLTTIFLVFKRY